MRIIVEKKGKHDYIAYNADACFCCEECLDRNTSSGHTQEEAIESLNERLQEMHEWSL